MFGNGTNNFVNARLAYAGGIGYGIYVEDKDGNVKFVGFTTENEYEYTNKSDNIVAVIVKVQYKDYVANASNGTKYLISLNGNDDNNNGSTSLITANIGNSATYSAGHYKEKDIVVKYNNRTITDKENLTIYYKITEKDISTTDKDEFVDRVNNLEPGNYDIEYTIYYNDEIASFRKKLILN